jgi:Ser/Thr protein kinase RdoA (MazF antagonist)
MSSTINLLQKRAPISGPSQSFIDALRADGPAPDRADKMGLYGWLIGAWEMDVVVHMANDSEYRGAGEIHFGWVLEGRAIQDVWITPSRESRGRGHRDDPIGAAANFYGSTFRIYDPGIDAWHIFWLDPVKQFYSRMIGRAAGRDIEQLTVNETPQRRWRFSEITPDSFHWTAEVDEGSAGAAPQWRRHVEFFARRIAI